MIVSPWVWTECSLLAEFCHSNFILFFGLYPGINPTSRNRNHTRQSWGQLLSLSFQTTVGESSRTHMAHMVGRGQNHGVWAAYILFKRIKHDQDSAEYIGSAQQSTPQRCFRSVHLQLSYTGSLIRTKMTCWKTSIRCQNKPGSYHTHFDVHPISDVCS